MAWNCQRLASTMTRRLRPLGGGAVGWVGLGMKKHKVGWGRLGEVKGMVVWGWCFGRGVGQGSDHRKVKVPLGSAAIEKSSWHVGLGCVYIEKAYT